MEGEKPTGKVCFFFSRGYGNLANFVVKMVADDDGERALIDEVVY